ncbi:MAG: hypothetical protein ACKO38_14960 [Planctomycetota bacterium]
MSSYRLIVAIALASIGAASTVSPAAAACGKKYNTHRPAPSCKNAVAPTAPQPATKAAKTYCICTPDNDGTFRVRGVTDNADKALRAAEILQAEGIQAWAMEMKPVNAQAGGLTLTNGEAAIAIAYNIGKGKVRAAAIGESGVAEAIAQP